MVQNKYTYNNKTWNKENRTYSHALTLYKHNIQIDISWQSSLKKLVGGSNYNSTTEVSFLPEKAMPMSQKNNTFTKG